MAPTLDEVAPRAFAAASFIDGQRGGGQNACTKIDFQAKIKDTLRTRQARHPASALVAQGVALSDRLSVIARPFGAAVLFRAPSQQRRCLPQRRGSHS
jgi:hypothetical protein